MANNVEQIIGYFESGIKAPGTTGRLGVELEHILTDEHFNPVPYSDEHGARWLIEQLLDQFPEAVYGEDGALIGASGPNMAISLEPAAQFELSAGPYEYAKEIRPDIERMERRVTALLAPYGRRLVTVGYHPKAKADELELIPKQRYRIMDAHFQEIGPYGRCMMRGSAATQISIDYYSEADCLRKMRLASGIAPIFSLICDNSPAFEGTKRTHQLVRTKIWRECDPARCGLVPGVMDPGFSFERYAQYILATPAVVALDENGKLFATEEPFDTVYDSRTMGAADVEHALSMFFNDVRLKTYVEIRPADSMPTPFVAAYAAFVKGLFYYDEALDQLDDLLEGVTESDVEQAKTDLMAQGYDAVMYGLTAGELADRLFRLVCETLSPLEQSCLAPISSLIKSRKTLATMGERSIR